MSRESDGRTGNNWLWVILPVHIWIWMNWQWIPKEIRSDDHILSYQHFLKDENNFWCVYPMRLSICLEFLWSPFVFLKLAGDNNLNWLTSLGRHFLCFTLAWGRSCKSKCCSVKCCYVKCCFAKRETKVIYWERSSVQIHSFVKPEWITNNTMQSTTLESLVVGLCWFDLIQNGIIAACWGMARPALSECSQCTCVSLTQTWGRYRPVLPLSRGLSTDKPYPTDRLSAWKKKANIGSFREVKKHGIMGLFVFTTTAVSSSRLRFFQCSWSRMFSPGAD